MLFLFASCAPKINTQITKTYPTLNFNDEVKVFGLKTVLPANIEVIGSIKIGDTGFTLNCNYETVLENAKIEARKIGGNAIKITEHLFPSVFGSSCHRIKAVILKIDNVNKLNIIENINSDDFNSNKNELLTQITLNDGRVLKGFIKNDMDGVIYFTLVKNGTSTETQVNKSEIKEIIKP
ncbi:MAG: hypothetical protein EAZ51_02490 [Sphingobacteriales bacterium]|nr:MAG: hypothetical protein EAZ64_03425 [Sphingobacteriales bacterium]TAF82421.1 MAG: hypothetical protein EAZ51_02490 [Sphingobacteriales bacterium]